MAAYTSVRRGLWGVGSCLCACGCGVCVCALCVVGVGVGRWPGCMAKPSRHRGMRRVLLAPSRPLCLTVRAGVVWFVHYALKGGEGGSTASFAAPSSSIR